MRGGFERQPKPLCSWAKESIKSLKSKKEALLVHNHRQCRLGIWCPTGHLLILATRTERQWRPLGHIFSASRASSIAFSEQGRSYVERPRSRGHNSDSNQTTKTGQGRTDQDDKDSGRTTTTNDNDKQQRPTTTTRDEDKQPRQNDKQQRRATTTTTTTTDEERQSENDKTNTHTHNLP